MLRPTSPPTAILRTTCIAMLLILPVKVVEPVSQEALTTIIRVWDFAGPGKREPHSPSPVPSVSVAAPKSKQITMGEIQNDVVLPVAVKLQNLRTVSPHILRFEYEDIQCVKSAVDHRTIL